MLKELLRNLYVLMVNTHVMVSAGVRVRVRGAGAYSFVACLVV